MVGLMKKRTEINGLPPAGPHQHHPPHLGGCAARNVAGPAGGRDYEAARVHAELSVIAEHRSAFDHFSR